MDTAALRKAHKVMLVVTYHQRMKQRAIDYKGGKCQRCGYNKSADALTFHHRDPSQKDFNISARLVKWDTLVPELDKCDLLCSNCHLEEHAIRARAGKEELYNQIREVVPARVISARVTKPCGYCGSPVTRFSSNKALNYYCNRSCARKAPRRAWPPKEELEQLVWRKPGSHVAKDLGVAGSALRKHCRKLGIAMPGRGYWQKADPPAGGLVVRPHDQAPIKPLSGHDH